MFTVARAIQGKEISLYIDPITKQQGIKNNTSRPVFNTKPRFIVSNNKSTKLENFKPYNPLAKEKKKLRFKLSVCKDPTNTNLIPGKKLKKVKESRIKTIRKREGNFHCGRWQPDEHKRFIEAIFKYGNEWKAVQKHVGTRSSTQARSHAQKFFVKIKNSKLFDFDVDFSKDSIATLHSLATNLNSDEYFSAIKALNCVAFERKPNIRKRQRRDDATSSFMSDFSSTINTNTIGLW
jgi:SHAQKYF class myb-like DNA-binding protein